MKTFPILILHGWNLSASRFIPLQREFQKRGFEVLCPDLPGFGSARLPERPLNLSDYILFVEGFLKSKKADRVVLIGHSFGGRIGIKLAADNPTMLHALILTGTPGISPVPRIKILFFLLLASVGKMIFSLPILSYFGDAARKVLYKTARAADFYRTDEKMRETFKNIVKEDLIPYLIQVKIPTLVLWGEGDKIVPMEIAEKMSKLIKNARLVVIPDARHGFPWTHSKLFTDEVEEFLKSLD